MVLLMLPRSLSRQRLERLQGGCCSQEVRVQAYMGEEEMKDNNPYNEDNWVGALGNELPDQEDIPKEARMHTLVCMHCGEPQPG